MAETLLDVKMREFDRMKSDRETFTSHWMDVSRYVLPEADFYKSYMPGQKRNYRIFDTTGMMANEQLANSLHSMLTSPQSRWFQLTVADVKKPVDRAGKEWLDDTTDRLYRIFGASAGGFNTQCHEMYLQLCAFGNGMMYLDFRGGAIRFRTRALSDCFVRENEYGQVDTLYRRTTVSAHAATMFFGKLSTEGMKKRLDKDPRETMDIIHCVEPRNGLKEYGLHKSQKPFESTFINATDNELISEGGYDDFPYLTPRFGKRSGEEYGYGPGMTAFPEVRMANRIKELMIRSAEKMVDPPLMVPDDGVIGPLSLNAAARITVRPGEAGLIRPLVTNAEPQLAQDILGEVQQRIRELFYVEWLSLEQGPQMTATEVMDRRDKSFQMIGPMISRVESEFCGPLINRTFNIAYRNGMLGPLPDSLKGRQLKIDYTSPIARAQKASVMESISRTYQFAMNLAETGVDPDAMQNLDVDKTVRYIARELNNMPEELLKDPQEVTAARKVTADAQATAQRQQGAIAASKVLASGAQAGNALSQMQPQGNA